MLTKTKLKEMYKGAMRDSEQVGITTALLLYEIKDLLAKSSEPVKKAKPEVKKVDKSRTTSTSRKKT